MKKNKIVNGLLCLSVLVSMVAPIFGQKLPKPVIFAVLNDGTTLEPVAFVEKGKLTAPVGGDSDGKIIAAFNRTYYKPKGTYPLIFGGVNSGTITIISSDEKSDCGKNLATVTAQSAKTKLSGFVMGLATNAAAPKKAASGTRRKPTPAERTEIEALVRAEFADQKVSAAALKNLHYQNLTALDVDNDKKVEFVGSFWVETGKTDRALLFFIAEKNSAGKYEFDINEFRAVKQEELMSGAEIKTIDDGIYHEVLLDVFDYDGDGVGEIFTYTPSFEGAGFNAYKREKGKWTKAFEGSNYHCAF